MATDHGISTQEHKKKVLLSRRDRLIQMCLTVYPYDYRHSWKIGLNSTSTVETRDLTIFELTVAKGGVKAKLSDDQGPILPPAPGTPPPRPGGSMPRGNISLMIGGGELHAASIPFANFVATLSQILGRTVVDKTDLKGLYDFDLKWTPDVGQAVGPAGALPPGVELPPIYPSGPSLVTALQEQLGLRLESAKGPVQVLVIDSVQRPSEN
jgi:uncharacterized protein (TIGR03435 family)